MAMPAADCKVASGWLSVIVGLYLDLMIFICKKADLHK